MSVVYNNLTEKIGFIINDYFSGKDNSVKLKQRARKDLHMFIAKEFHVLNYAVASRDVYKQVCMLWRYLKNLLSSICFNACRDSKIRKTTKKPCLI